ncbi:MAG TPA: hypothetical protein VIT90_10880 [Lysobacter sp.]
MNDPSRLLKIALPVAVMLTAAMNAGCSSPVRTTTPVSVHQDFTLQPGGRAALPQEAALRYVGVDQDSRCPPEVTCVWAGDAQVKLVFEQAGRTEDVVLHAASPTPQTLGPWTLTLLRLEPGASPAATLRLDDAPRP